MFAIRTEFHLVIYSLYVTLSSIWHQIFWPWLNQPPSPGHGSKSKPHTHQPSSISHNFQSQVSILLTWKATGISSHSNPRKEKTLKTFSELLKILITIINPQPPCQQMDEKADPQDPPLEPQTQDQEIDQHQVVQRIFTVLVYILQRKRYIPSIVSWVKRIHVA